MNLKTQRMGGVATAIKLRKEALERYYKNPSICLYCKEVIQVEDGHQAGEYKRKKFCNRKCFSLYRIQPKKEQVKKARKKNINSIENKTKSDFVDTKHYHSRIRSNSRMVYRTSGKKLECFVCGYSRFVEICHIKDIKDFDDNCLISEINNIDNLIALCPNHHYEFDNDLLKIEFK